MSLYNPSIFGVFASNPAGSGHTTPGGPINSVQYNVNGVDFGGFGIVDVGLQTLDLTGWVLTALTYNGVPLTSTGDGNSALFNDGSYKPLSASDNLFAIISDGTIGDILFTFPTSIAEDLSIQFNGSQLELVNGSAVESIYFSYHSAFDFPSLTAFPALNQEGALILLPSTSSTLDSSVGYDLSTEPLSYQKSHISVRSSLLSIDSYIDISLYYDVSEDDIESYQCNGKYDVYESS